LHKNKTLNLLAYDYQQIPLTVKNVQIAQKLPICAICTFI